MGIRVYKPTTNGRRRSSVLLSDDLTAKKPEKSLTKGKSKRAGRNNQGKITTRHKGGGNKKLYRVIDFKQNKFDIPAKVATIEYDPNRSARIALLNYADGEKRYIIAPLGVKVGDKILSSEKKIDAKPGNRMPLEFIPTGTPVNNLELFPGKGGMLARSAGSGMILMALEGNEAILKLPSGEVRKFSKKCQATVGQVSNTDWKNVRWGKAGRMRLRGIRPTVRGKAMNPVDHPHGGGEGRNPIGIKRGPKTPWGKLALGVKTRKANKKSNKFIVKRRKTKRK